MHKVISCFWIGNGFYLPLCAFHPDSVHKDYGFPGSAVEAQTAVIGENGR